MKRYAYILLMLCMCSFVYAQSIPMNLSYTQVYGLLDELTAMHVIETSSAIKPYTRTYIAQKLQEAQDADSLLSRRQRNEVKFYLNDLALECDTVPDNWVEWTNRKTFNLSLAQPSFHYITNNKKFKLSIKPILGAEVFASKKGAIVHRWYGAELNMDIAHHVSLWGSLRDNSWNGKWLLSGKYYPTDADKRTGAQLSRAGYLNTLNGLQYKEADYGGDFSDSRGGIAIYDWWGRLSVERESIVWGDSYFASNILSAKAPAFPMIKIHLQPVRWFEFTYFHAWLVSNVVDSTYYYVEHSTTGEQRQYRPMNKYMAANMFTFTPIPYFSFSLGNSIIYAERNPQAAYFIPIAFYKSLDHLLTKGVSTQNQNSQVFFTINTRNLKYANFYASLYIDEFSISRLKKSNQERNPVSWLVGASVSNWPLRDLTLQAEFMRTNIACYTHSISELAYTSNSYFLGNYLYDNAQSINARLIYRPVKSLRVSLQYTNEVKYNSYSYLRAGYEGSQRVREGGIAQTLSQKPFNEKIYQNHNVELETLYEVFNGCYAVLRLQYNSSRGYAPQSTPIASEDRGGNDATGKQVILEGTALEQYYLNKFSPLFWQGNNFTTTVGLSFNF